MAKRKTPYVAAGQRAKNTKTFTVFPKQKAFIDCDAECVLYGGSAGGGKSYAQLIDALQYAIKYAGSRQLILRETFPELSRSLIQTSLELYPQEIGHYNSTEHVWYFFNGSIIEFGYLTSDSDVNIYQSAQYEVIRFDEGTHFSEYRITYMKSRIRGANNYPKQLKISTNPGGVGHKFIKKYFQIGVSEPNKIFKVFIGVDIFGKKLYETRCFIPSNVYDNEPLMRSNPEYVKMLLSLPEREKKALLEGSWDIFDDQAFPEFDYNVHVCPSFKPPEHWRKWMSGDNGFNDPFAWYWYAVDEQGTVYVYREYSRTRDQSKVIYSEQASKIVEKSTYTVIENGQEIIKREKIGFTVVGHDAWATHVRDQQGKTLIDYYADGGVTNCVKAITDRRLRKAVIHEYLKPFMDENTGKMTAKLQIMDNCKLLIETLSELILDPDDHEKYMEDSELDHWTDSLGYGLLAYHAAKSRTLQPEKTEIQKHKDSLARNLKKARIRA